LYKKLACELRLLMRPQLIKSLINAGLSARHLLE